MKAQELMGRVVEELYQGLTGGSAELPLPSGIKLNWILPGIPFHESFFDFAVAGPFSGPSPATMESFEQMCDVISGKKEDPSGENTPDTNSGGNQMSREEVIRNAKIMYQTHLLGCWEQWSRLVDFIPLMNAKEDDMSWRSSDDEGKFKHKSIVYAQANQTLSGVYKDSLTRCWVAEEKLTQQQEDIIVRMKKLLQIKVEKEDFLTGEKIEEFIDSPAMTLYNKKKLAYENAVTDYASRMARSQSGSVADVVEWNRSGGIYRERALQALRDWQSTGNKNAIETAQSAISHITGSNMVRWKQNLLDAVTDIDISTQGSYGYSFFPATVLPGAFARSEGWTKFSETSISQSSSSNSTTHSGGAQLGFTCGLFSIGAAGGGSTTESDFEFDRNDFGIEFEYTQVEICRPAFNPNFFLSRGWKPKDSFINDYGTDKHSTGGDNPEGALVGYPTKALFVRNLKITSSKLSRHVQSKESDIQAGGVVGIGPFIIGGNYAQKNQSNESNFTLDNAGIQIKGIQLVAFISAILPESSNPNPDVENWI